MSISEKRLSGILDWTLVSFLVLFLLYYFTPGNPILKYFSYPPNVLKASGEYLLLSPQETGFLIKMGVIFGVLAGISFLSLRLDRRIVYIGLSCLLTYVYYETNTLPWGDTRIWTVQAAHKQAWLSEPFSNVLYYYMKRMGILEHLAGFFGFLNSLLFFLVADRLYVSSRDEREAGLNAVIVSLAYVGSGVHLYYFSGTIENTYTSTPFLLGFLYFYTQYWYRNRQPGTRGIVDGDLAVASLFLVVASFFHGQNVFLYPAIPIAAAWKYSWHSSPRRMARDLVTSHALMLLVAGVCYLVLIVLGFEVVAGNNVTGGADQSLFVPLGEMTSVHHRFLFFSGAHFGLVAGILSLASPLFLAVPMLVVLGWKDAWKRGVFNTALVFPALGYICFLLLWNFDYGFPKDYDLMVSMGITVNLCLLSAACGTSMRIRYLMCLLVLPSSILSWYFFVSFTY
jgi:hypothetical protein